MIKNEWTIVGNSLEWEKLGVYSLQYSMLRSYYKYLKYCIANKNKASNFYIENGGSIESK